MEVLMSKHRWPMGSSVLNLKAADTGYSLEGSENCNKSRGSEDNQQKLPKDKITEILTSYKICLKPALCCSTLRQWTGCQLLEKILGSFMRL